MRTYLTFGIIGLLLFTSSCLTAEKHTPKNKKAGNSIEQRTPELKIFQQTISKYPSSEKVEFNVIANQKYNFAEPIIIALVWINKSETDQKIMIREYWEHPIAVGASIIDLKTNSKLEKYPSTHVLSSQLYLGKELEDYEIILKPNESKTFKVDLKQIPYFNNTELDRTKNIPKGKYSAQVSYYQRISSAFEFEVK